MSKYDVNCCSSNLIYCLQCKKCGIQYVGQTGSEIKERFKTHFDKITHPDRDKRTNQRDTSAGHHRADSEIGSHFRSPGHNGIDDVIIYVVDFIFAAPTTAAAAQARNLSEFNWIQRLHTTAPIGLNIGGPSLK